MTLPSREGERNYPPGVSKKELLINGKRPDSLPIEGTQGPLYLLKSGFVITYLSWPDGVEVCGGYYRPDSLLGEPLNPRETRDFPKRVVPLEDSELLSIDRRYLGTFTRTNPEIVQALQLARDHDILAAERRIAMLSHEGVHARLAWLLRELGGDASGENLQIALTQGVLADMIAISRPSTNQAIRRMRKNGILATGTRQTVLAKDGFKALDQVIHGINPGIHRVDRSEVPLATKNPSMIPD